MENILKMYKEKLEPDKQAQEKVWDKVSKQGAGNPIQSNKSGFKLGVKTLALVGTLFMLFLVVSVTGGALTLNYLTRDSKSDPLKGLDQAKNSLSYASSCKELTSSFEKYQDQTKQRNYGISEDMAEAPTASDGDLNSSGGSGAPGYYTQTNIQVAGIDEGDVIKTNGQKLFVVNSQERKVDLLKVFPTNESKKVGEIKFSDSTPQQLFVYGDKLVVFTNPRPDIFVEEDERKPSSGGGSSSPSSPSSLPSTRIADGDFYHPGYNTNAVRIEIYDVEDLEDPELIRKVDMEGSLVTTRLKDGYIYLITNKYAWNDFEKPIPLMRDYGFSDKPEDSSSCGEVAILDDQYVYPRMTSVLALNLKKDREKAKVSNFVGDSTTVYMSHDNIYLVSNQYQGGNFFLPSEQVTVVNKLSYVKNEIDFEDKARFRGTLLNQFSLDEYEGNLRIAGTLGNTWDNTSENYLLIFDKDMEPLSQIRDLANGERIYSVRFQGDIGVVVTFKKVDPLFVFDLSDGKNPKLEGELKIPGYSDYLQFIDEDTVIGLGKDAIDAGSNLTEQRGSDFAWYQGLKLGLFDISDRNKPKELSSVVIGDRGTESPALTEHKAFVFDKKHNLIMFPASIAKVDKAKCSEQNYLQDKNACYGDLISQGAQVVQMIDKKQLKYQGEITHLEAGESALRYYYGSTNKNNVTRIIVVDDVIFTISGDKVKLSGYKDLKVQKDIDLD